MKGFMISAFAAQLANGEVVKLTPENFDEITGKGKALVKFFAPWCGHCKNMAPHYEADSENVEEGVILAEMDCDDATNKEICSAQGIQGFPTLKWFEGDGAAPEEYDGGRGAGSFVEWTSAIMRPVVQEIEKLPEDVKGKLQVTLVGETLTDDFQKLAKANRKHAIFNFLKEEAGWFGGSKLVISKEGEPNIEDSDVTKVTELVNEHRFPLFGELNGETYGDYVSREGRDMLWTLMKFDEGKMAEAIDTIKDDMSALAKDFKKFSFTYTDTVQFAQPIEGMLGITTDMLPAAVVQRGKKKFVMKDEITKDNMEKFLKSIESGELQPEVKSEAVPEENPKADNGKVRTVVATEMESELFRDDKDVLVKVYAPWCGHCKNMAPDYVAASEELGDDVILAELDGSANDSTIDSIEWQGFPTLFFIKAGSKTPEPYNGPRDKAGIVNWVKENASKKSEEKPEEKTEQEEL